MTTPKLPVPSPLEPISDRYTVVASQLACKLCGAFVADELVHDNWHGVLTYEGTETAERAIEKGFQKP